MPISDWFRSREQRRYTVSSPAEGRSAQAHGAWAKCDECGHILYEGELVSTRGVCPHCDHHGRLPAHARIDSLADPGTFEELWADMHADDPLSFQTAKPYEEGLRAARERTGLADAVVTGRAALGGHEVMLGAMDFAFIGASMGSVVGEKMVRTFEVAGEEGRAVVLVVASGGARMQEGMLSLTQMARTSDAVRRYREGRSPYVAVLTHPTTGGVTASFASLADVTFAEPRALIGFAGPRVIEQTIGEKPPKGFQSAEAVLSHGFVDEVVHRERVRARLRTVLDHLHRHEGTPR